jgi:hypothetical protein
MTRRRLTNGKWYDENRAIEIREGGWWNGSNFISYSTGSQWDHESLSYTAGGNWVLCRWSQWQGTETTWEQVDQSVAFEWLARNNRAELPSDIPAALRGQFAEHCASLEV